MQKWNTQKPTRPGRYLVTKIDRWDESLVLDIAEWYIVGGGDEVEQSKRDSRMDAAAETLHRAETRRKGAKEWTIL